jgi:hypothetical protein
MLARTGCSQAAQQVLRRGNMLSPHFAAASMARLMCKQAANKESRFMKWYEGHLEACPGDTEQRSSSRLSY